MTSARRPERVRGAITLVILAGGRGERLGGLVKPLLRFSDGTTLLERIESELRPEVADVLVVARAEIHPYLRAVTGARLLADRCEGPHAALLEASFHVRTPWLALVGGDHPRPCAPLLGRLRASAEAKDGAVVRQDGVLEPLFAILRTSALRTVASDAQCRSLYAVLSSLALSLVDAIALPENERAALEDVDTEAAARAAGLHSEGVPRF